MCLLDRDWKSDQKNFSLFLEQFEHHPRPVCVFLCPEGTTITQGSSSFLSLFLMHRIAQSLAGIRKTHRPSRLRRLLISFPARVARSAAPLDRPGVHHPANPRVGEGERRDGLSVRHHDAVRRLHR